MSDFETSGSVRIEVDQQSLRQARDEVEETIGSVSISGAGQARTDGGGRGGRQARRMLRTSQTQADELQSQTALLEDVVDLLEGDESGGGVLGGGGGSGGGGDGGLGAFGGAALGSGSSALLARLGLGGAAGAGGLLGLGVVRLLQETGTTDAIRNGGQATRENLPGGETIGDAAQFIPGAQGAAAILDLTAGDTSFSRSNEIAERRRDILADTFGGTGVDADGPPPRTGSQTGVPVPDDIATTGSPGSVPSFGSADLPADPNNTSDLDSVLFNNGSRRSARELLPLAAKGRLSGDDVDQLSERGIFDESQLAAIRQSQEAGEIRLGPIRDRIGDTNLGDGLSASGVPAGVVGASGGSGPTTVSVNAPVSVDSDSGDVERQLNERLERLKQDILGRIPNAAGDISREQQSRFQRGY